jgi:hypothetical protein
VDAGVEPRRVLRRDIVLHDVAVDDGPVRHVGLRHTTQHSASTLAPHCGVVETQPRTARRCVENALASKGTPDACIVVRPAP